MEINFKNKSYEIKDTISDDSFVILCKNKLFLLKTFDTNTDEFNNFLKRYKRLKISGVRIPKLKKIDKKNQKVLLEYIEGTSVIDTLSKQDLKDEFYSQVFEASWYADHEKITLDFHPDKWIMSKDNKLYYMAYSYFDGIDNNAPFKTTGIKFWFFTKEFVMYAKKLGYSLDESRLKDEYLTNKEIVLKVVQFYM